MLQKRTKGFTAKSVKGDKRILKATKKACNKSDLPERGPNDGINRKLAKFSPILFLASLS